MSENGNGSKKAKFLDTYRMLAIKNNVLPRDQVLNGALGCGSSTLSAIRWRLTTEEGFEFEKTVHGFKVTKRPGSTNAAEPAAPIAKNAPKSVSESKIVGAQLALPGVNDDAVNTLTERVDVMLDVVTEILAVMNRLAAVWSA